MSTAADSLLARGLGDWAEREPDRPALLLDGEQIGYRSLFERAVAIALALEGAGAGVGPVALLLRNSAAFIEVTCACNLLGVVHVPLDYHAARPEVELLLADSGAAALVCERDWLADAPGDVSADSWLTVEDLAALPAPGEAERSRFRGPPRPVDGYRMTYTSGTTGRPKAVLREPSGGVEWLRRLWTALDLRPDDRHLSAGPYYHAGPNTFVMGQLVFGASVAISTRFDPAELLARVERERLTSLQLVPTMLRRIRALGPERLAAHDLSSLRVLFHAAAPCPPELKRWALQSFGVETVREYYASSEVGATAITGPEWLERPGSVGRPLAACAVRVIDAHGRDVPAGSAGRVCLRAEGRSTFHYRGGEGRAAAASLGDGWVATDDVGYLDADGYLYLVDRDADVIISGGVNVYSRKVENVLLEHPAIADAAVFGLPDADLGERVAAAVQLRAAASLATADLEDFVRSRLTPAERPRVLRIVSELPRSEAGKVLKAELRQPPVGTSLPGAPQDPPEKPQEE